MPDDPASAPRWEHFRHGADAGIRGIAPTEAQAFEQAALALTAVVTAPENVHPVQPVAVRCNATDDEFLFIDWINALIFEMSTRAMLFSRFDVAIDRPGLAATAWGEPVDRQRHSPAVEPKGATFTELSVRHEDNRWLAQCVVDV